MSIKYFDLKENYLSIKKDIDKKVIEIISSTNYSLGNYVEEFEDSFAKFNGIKHCVGVNSGTSAIHLALLAHNIGSGDEVITVSMTFIATAMAISYTGAKPVFVDIEDETKLINPKQIEKKITSRTKAIIPVHLYGQCANMNEINRIAKKYKLVVIEDASQAHGSLFNENYAGTMGDAGTFSFYPGKNLGAYGEAGAVITKNKKLKEKISSLRNWGQKNKRYYHDDISYNYRMDGIQAGVLSIKLKKLKKWTKQRRAIAEEYQAHLDDNSIEYSYELKNRYHVYHIFSVFHKNSIELKNYLISNGVSTNNHYPIPIHKQKPYKFLGYKDSDLPLTSKYSKYQLSLPIYPELKINDVRKISKLINNWLLLNK